MGNPIANAKGDDLLYGGVTDPRVNPIDVPSGAIYVFAPEVGTGALLRKLDDGVTGNYEDITPSNSIAKAPNTVFVMDNGEFATLQEAVDAAPDNTTFVIGPKAGGWGTLVLPQKNLSFFGLIGARPELVVLSKIECPTGPSTTTANFTNISVQQLPGENAVTVSGTGVYRLRFNECRMIRPSGDTTTMIAAVNNNANSSLYFYDCRIRTTNDEVGGRIVDTNCVRVIFSRSELIGGNKSLFYNGTGRVDAAFTLFQVESTQSVVEMQTGTLIAPVTTFFNGLNNGSGLEIGPTAVANLQSVSFIVNPGSGFAIAGSGVLLAGYIDFSNVTGVNPKNFAIENTITRFNTTSTAMQPDFSNAVNSTKDLNLGGFKLVNVANPTNAQDVVTLDYFNNNLPSGGNLWSDPVDANILPDASDQRNLGSQTNQFKEIHNESVFLYQGGSPNLSAAVDNSGPTFNIYSNAKPIIIQSRVTSNFSSDIIVNTAGASLLSGSINISTGDSGSQSGSILLSVGPASNQGSITFQDGSEGTVGHVWTSKGVNGEGEWAAPAGGGGDLWSDPVNSNIIPDADGTYDLGVAGNSFLSLTVNTIRGPIDATNLIQLGLPAGIRFGKNVEPSSNQTQQLGSSARKWNAVWTEQIRGIDNAQNFDFATAGVTVSSKRINYSSLANINHVWESGASIARPTPVLGMTYFDTDLGIPIWYDGTNWVDAAGTTVL